MYLTSILCISCMAEESFAGKDAWKMEKKVSHICRLHV